MTTTALPWHPFLHSNLHCSSSYPAILFTTHHTYLGLPARHVAVIQAFRRSDFDGFAKRVASGEALKDAWRSANQGFEQLLFDARRAAERFDRQFSISRRFESATRSAVYRAREIDQELGIGRWWRTFTMDFGRNWPRVSILSSFSFVFIAVVGNLALTTLFWIWYPLGLWLSVHVHMAAAHSCMEIITVQSTAHLRLSEPLIFEKR